MPIYEYRCAKGHTFEVMQPMSAGPVTACETCSAPVERIFHPIAVHFKGSGFYNTDYGTKKRSRETKEYKESNKSEKSKDGGAKDSASSSGSSSSGSGSSGSSGSGSSGSSGSSSSGSGSSKSDSGATKAPSKSSSD
jgi:putative FmdB family regulatory protein